MHGVVHGVMHGVDRGSAESEASTASMAVHTAAGLWSNTIQGRGDWEKAAGNGKTLIITWFNNGSVNQYTLVDGGYYDPLALPLEVTPADVVGILVDTNVGNGDVREIEELINAESALLVVPVLSDPSDQGIEDVGGSGPDGMYTSDALSGGSG